VIVAAAVCPWPPVLARDLTGVDPVVPALRDACGLATERLVRSAPDLVAVVGPAAATGQWDPTSRLDLAVFAPGLFAPSFAPGPTRIGDPALPASLGLGAMLLDQAGYTGPRLLQAVSEEQPPDRCADLGTAIAGSAARVGLLAMADGSARRSERAPGHFDERAAAFDAETERALRDGDLEALLALDAGLARDLMATGRPALQVLAGAIRPTKTAAEILYSDVPFGVSYLVAFVSADPVSADPLRERVAGRPELGHRVLRVDQRIEDVARHYLPEDLP
jgi:hypothetical protein